MRAPFLPISIRSLISCVIVSLSIISAAAGQISLPPPPADPRYVCMNCADDAFGARTESTMEARRRTTRQRQRESQFFYEDGLNFVDKGNWDNAIRSFEEALNKTPDDPDIQTWLKRAQDGKRAQSAARRSLGAGDWAAAGMALADGLASAGTTFFKPAPGTVIALGAESLREDGLIEFQRANIEYRRSNGDPGVPMFRGSPEAERRYVAARDALLKSAQSLQATVVDASAIRPRINALSAATAALEVAHGNEMPASVKKAADEWRQAVLRAAIGRAAVVAATPLAAILADGVRGENDRDTIDFIREMERLCGRGTEKQRNDPQCPTGNAYHFKNQGDPRSYPARRNAEHYLFMKGLAREFGIAGATAGSFFTPSCSILKQLLPGSTYATTPPSKDEIKWAYLGAVVGLTGALDPTE